MSYVRQFGAERLAGFVVIDGAPQARGDPETEWCWYTGHFDDPFLVNFTHALLRGRDASNEEFADWMLESSTPEKRRFIIDMADRTPDAIAALLSWEAVTHRDESDMLIGLEGRVPLLYAVRQEWDDVVAA